MKADDIVNAAKAEAQKIRMGSGIPVRVIERDGMAVWSKIDDEGKDLTAENSEGMLYHVRSIYAPHGEVDAITALRALADERTSET